ncbi:39301_t:CDS:1, partial [Gigaspora margarita]
EVSQKVELVTSFLDPHLKFINDIDIKKDIISIVQRLCDKTKYHRPLVQKILKNNKFVKSSSRVAFRSIDLIADLYNNEESNKITNEFEVVCYFCEPIQKRNYDPLK